MSTNNSRDYSLENFNFNFVPSLAAINDEVNKISHTLEAHFASVASSINEALRTTPWLPDSIKPPRRTIRHAAIPAAPAPVGYLEYSQDWISRHRALTAAIIAFVGTGAFVIIWQRRRRSHGGKRRARRAKNGSRTEVVVIAGSPHSLLTRSLSLDLERRGFIVYIPVSDLSEEQLVQSESRADIRPLNLDITSPTATANTLEKFTALLSRPHRPLPHTSSHHLHLASFLVLPSTPPPTGPISVLHPVTWSDTLTTQLLAPFTTLHAFLPLLTAHKSSLLFLTPSIVPSLAPAMHGPANVAAGALQGYIDTLRKESATQDLQVVQLKLGTFDLGAAPTSWSLIPARDPGVQGEPTLRADSARGRFARDDARSPGVKGSPVRELHLGVFDAIVRDRGRGGIMFVGRGSRLYAFVSSWVPRGVVGWMLGAAGEQARADESAIEGSAEWEKVEGAS